MGRKELLLKKVIIEYLRCKEPIGSESLKLSMNAKFSSATIRNYFKALTNEGWLFQPHISSGRVPTNRALKSHWYKELDVKSVLKLKSLDELSKASKQSSLFCVVSLEESNRLKQVSKITEDKLLLEFENLGVSLPFSATMERFLHELKGLDLADVRKIAYQVRAHSLLQALECVQRKKLSYYGGQILSRVFADGSNADSDQSLYHIIDGRIFDQLESGIYCDEKFPQGSMAVMQDLEIESDLGKRARMLCVGALDSNFTHFYECFNLKSKECK